MAIPPPFQVPPLIASAYPELLLTTQQQMSIVANYVSNAPGLEQFSNTIASQGPPTPNSGWARAVNLGTVSRLDLSTVTLGAFPAFLSPVLNSVMNDSQLQDFCWTVQDGVVPGPEPVADPSDSWSLPQLEPQNGLEFGNVRFDGQLRSFSVVVANKMPRHLGLYVEFLQAGLPVSPTGWTSKLPAGVPTTYESVTVKFLATLVPNTPVAGIAVSTVSKTLTINLPDNADSVKIIFGGIGNGQWISQVDAAGVILTFILDYAVPMIANSGKPITPAWFQGLLNDGQVTAEILTAGQFIFSDTGITDVSSLLGALATKLPSIMLDDLPTLRGRIEKQAGTDAVQKAAPYLGWPASTLQSLVNAQTATSSELFSTSSQILGVPSTFGLTLAPSTAIDLEVELQSDDGWPFPSAKYEVAISYGGYTQQQSAAFAPTDSGDSLVVQFGSVRNTGGVGIAAQLFDGQQRLLAKGIGSAAGSTSPTDRVVKVPLSLEYARVSVGKGTQFVRSATLTYSGQQYQWDTGAPPPEAVRSSIGGVGPGTILTRLVQLSLEQASQTLGYVWCVSGSGLQSCGGTTPLQTACLIQNIGEVNPSLQLKTINCGFAQSPYLAYGRPGLGSSGEGVGGYFVDPRGAQPCLRRVTFQPGPFDLSQATCYGQFRESTISAVALHPSGYAMAVSFDNSRLEIVKLDARAPVSQIMSGPGTRAGLILQPVAVAVTPSGIVLVLEQGNARVQAFDVCGNPVPLFGAEPFLMLETATNAQYQDLAVSPSGLIYVLAYQNGGNTVSDYFLNVYSADGSFLTRTTGVNAAKIAVGMSETVYTLNYASITGYAGHTEPSLSVWLPSI